jgi:hypothetical protein
VIGRYVKMPARPGLQTGAGRARVGEIIGMLQSAPERIDVNPLGGVGLEG